jgi:hypothetical protein
MPSKWSNLSKIVPIVASLLVMTPLAAPQSSTGKISGVVAGDDGKLLMAVVTANRAGGPVGTIRATTASDGSFVLSGLPAGSYALCTSVKGGGYLDPCDWSAVVPTVQVGVGQAVSGYRLVAKKGWTLQVRVNDPSKALDSAAGPAKSSPHVVVGVFTEKHTFQPLALTSKDSGGRNVEGTIPFDKAVSLHIVGRDVQVNDASGAPVDLNGTTISVKHAATDAPKPLTFNVTAKAH